MLGPGKKVVALQDQSLIPDGEGRDGQFGGLHGIREQDQHNRQNKDHQQEAVTDQQQELIRALWWQQIGQRVELTGIEGQKLPSSTGVSKRRNRPWSSR